MIWKTPSQVEHPCDLRDQRKAIAGVSSTAHSHPIRLLVTMTALALASCADGGDAPRSRWKASYNAAECKALVSIPAIQRRCGGGNDERLRELWRKDPSNCLPYSASRPMSGILLHGFEESRFFEGAKAREEIPPRAFELDSNRTWMSFLPGVKEPTAIGKNQDEYTVTHVRLIGKRSLCPFGYGHLGGSDQEVIVERLISARTEARTR